MSLESSFLQELQRRNVIKVAAAYAVAAWILLQLADITFPALGLDDADILYLIIPLLIVFPLVVAFCWFYEITPDGVVPTRRVNPNESISGDTGKRINYIIIALLSIALLFFVVEYFTRDTFIPAPTTSTAVTRPVAAHDDTTQPEADASQKLEPAVPIASEVDPEPSIAVMPFVNMSSDEENEYFSDGLSEELLNVLAQIEGLRVAGRTSSFFYKGKNIDLREIGRELNVNNILEGSVRKVGNKVRVTAQLISTHDGFHLWSQTYDRELHDVFMIQDEISQEVANAMQLALLTDGVSVSESRQTSNPEAHDVYLQASQLLYDRREESILRSIELFKLAARLDPEYAPPYLGLANASMIAYNNHRSISLEEASRVAEESFEQAEALGYLNSDYWASRGLYHTHLVQSDPEHYELAKAAFDKALAQNKNNVDVLHWYSTLIRGEEPLALLEKEQQMITRAVQLDPHNRVIKMNYFGTFFGTPEEERGRQGLMQMAREDEDYDGYDQYLAAYALFSDRLIEAADHLARLDADNSRGYMLRGFLAYQVGGTELFERIVKQTPRSNAVYRIQHLLRVALSGSPQERIIEAKLLLNQPDNENMAEFLAFSLLPIGEPALAMALFENVSPSFRSRIPSEIGQPESSLAEYMLATYMTGDKERAQAMAHYYLETFKDRAHNRPPRGISYINAYCYLVLEDKEKVIGELQALFDAGKRDMHYQLITELPIAAGVRADPRYEPLIESTVNDLARVRPEVETIMSW